MRPRLASSAVRDAFLIPGVSSLAAAATLSYALFATRLDAEYEQPSVTPERAAQEFASAYRSRDYAKAAKLATGDLRRSLESRVRSARLRGARESPVPTARSFVIDESFVLAKDELRFAGVLAEADTPDAKGWPISITVVRDGDTYLAEALNWPKGPPPDDR
ncbi:MAG TPA: hypothetical protein VFG30_35070 [Polyangiales bacterium]|jgi:hypothetical protein|nr:hypothetical protein [Polyangiales bacterium]